MHFPTVALIGRYQDTGLDTPLRALAHALTQAGRQVLIDAGIKAIVQPGGSVRDDEVIDAARKAGVTMFFTGERHFFH